MNKLPSLAFLIPAYNDESTIKDVVMEALSVGKRIADRFSILIINDASTDGTARVIDLLERKHGTVSVIHHPRNRGYGATIRELYERGSGEWFFTVPGDGQIPPEEVLTLNAEKRNADMLLGWRTRRNDPPARLRQSRIYNGLLRFLFGIRLHDINSVRLMRSRIMEYVKLTTDSAFVDAELVIQAADKGFRVAETPIKHRSRASEEGAGGGKLGTIMPTIRDMVRFKVLKMSGRIR